jgi:FeS assembly SUF system protein
METSNDLSVEQRAVADRIIKVLKTIHDPEIPVNIYDLGLIYALDVTTDGRVAIEMTLTSPNCPVAGALVEAVEREASAVQGVEQVRVELTWEPPWSMERMGDEGRLELGLM